MKRVTAAVLIIVGVLGGIAFRLFVVEPAYKPLADGHYTEIYGPVSFFRIPVYIACAASVLFGVAIAIWSRPRNNLACN